MEAGSLLTSTLFSDISKTRKISSKFLYNPAINKESDYATQVAVAGIHVFIGPSS